MISKAKELFDFHMQEQGVTQETQPDVYKQQLDIFMALPKIQQYYSTDFRLDVEDWANHRIEIDTKKFYMKSLEKKKKKKKKKKKDLMFNKLYVTDPSFTLI